MSQATQLRTWARLGYVARGLFFVLVGYVALSVSRAEGTDDVLEAVENMELGPILLGTIMVGAFGYGLWKLYDAVANLDGHDQDYVGWIKRIAIGIGGIAYTLVGFAAAKVMFTREGDGSGGGDSAKEAAAETASSLFGDWIIVAAGLAIIVTGLNQLRKAATGDFTKHLAGNLPDLVKYAGTAGYAARGIIFLISGWVLAKTAWSSGETEVTGTVGALNALRDTGIIFTVVAVGLMAFGVFSIVESRYRIIPNRDLRPGH